MLKVVDGGVFRDILGTGLGARVIASTDMFCFAPPDLPYLAIPLGVLDEKAQLSTAPALTDPKRDSPSQPRVEHYQIFWTPSEAIVNRRLPQTIPQTIPPDRES